MPIKIPEAVGEPYRPSNGTEGMVFEEQWCDRCESGQEGAACEIFGFALMLDVDDDGYPKEWVHDENGIPKCTAFKLCGRDRN